MPSRNEPKETRFSRSKRQKVRGMFRSRCVYYICGCNSLVNVFVISFLPTSAAEAEAKYLSGVGVAKQRKAIVDGLRSSIVDFQGNVAGSSTKEVMDLLLLTQYFDMIRDVGSANHCKTTFVPSPRGPSDDMRNALLQTSADATK